MLCNKIYVSSTSKEHAKLFSKEVVPIYTFTSNVYDEEGGGEEDQVRPAAGTAGTCGDTLPALAEHTCWGPRVTSGPQPCTPHLHLPQPLSPAQCRLHPAPREGGPGALPSWSLGTQGEP